MYQDRAKRGFISIPLLIGIILAVVSSAAFGVVLERERKIDEISANVSEILNHLEDAYLQENIEDSRVADGETSAKNEDGDGKDKLSSEDVEEKDDSEAISASQEEQIEESNTVVSEIRIAGDEAGSDFPQETTTETSTDLTTNEELDNATPTIRYEKNPPIIYFNTLSIDELEKWSQINWMTDEPCAAKVLYDTTNTLPFQHESGEREPNEPDASHTVDMNNLDFGTRYYFLMVCEDKFGNVATSSIQSFTTKQEYGTLSVVLDESSPINTTYVKPGDTLKTLGIWRLSADDNQDITVNQIAFTNLNPTGSKNLQSLRLFWSGGSSDGKGVTQSVNNTKIFDSINLKVPQNKHVLISLKGNFSDDSTTLTEDYVVLKLDWLLPVDAHINYLPRTAAPVYVEL